MTILTASPRNALAVAVALALSACGGGGGGTSSGPVPTAAPAPLPTTAPTAAPTQAPTAAPPVILAVKGLAVDGYIAGATVYLDLNNNSVRDAGEPLTSTDSKGSFSFSVDQSTAGLANARLRIRGGTDLSTNLPFTSSMSAVFGGTAKASYPVTPLTTVLDAMVRSDPSTTMAQARDSLAKVLGVSNTAALDADPLTLALTEPTLLQKMVSIQKTIEILAASDKKSTETDTGAAVGRVASAIGAALKASAAALPAQPDGATLPSVAAIVNSAVSNQSQFFNNTASVHNTVALAADVANLTEATIAASVSQLLRDHPGASGAALAVAVSSKVDTRIAAIAPLQAGANAAAAQSATAPNAAVARLDIIATSTNVNQQLKALVLAAKSLTNVPPASAAPNPVIDALQQAVNVVPTLAPGATPTTAPTAAPTSAPTTAPTTAPTASPTTAPSGVVAVTSTRSITSLTGITSLRFPAGYTVSLINSSGTDGIVILQGVNASTGDIITATISTNVDAGIFSKASFTTLTGVTITSV